MRTDGGEAPTTAAATSGVHPKMTVWLDDASDAGWSVIEAAIARVRAAGGRVVTTNGCFDLLHPGHVALLEAARSHGDLLIVALNSDQSVKALKGPSRPALDEMSRSRMLLALSSVDHVVIYGDRLPVRVLERVRPDVHCKGADYRIEDLPEAPAVAKLGGTVALVPFLSGYSTSRILSNGGADTLPKGLGPGRARAEQAPRGEALAMLIPETLPDFSKISAVVIGDAMLDVFLYGRAERMSQEAPVPIVELTSREVRLGGAANVAHNLAMLGARARLLALRGDDDDGDELAALAKEANIDAHFVVVPGRPTSAKTRVIATRHQLLRIDREEIAPPPAASLRELMDGLDGASSCNVVIVSDYLKGVVTASIMEQVRALSHRALVLVDPKRTDFSFYRGAAFIKPNLAELAACLGCRPAEVLEQDRLTRLAQRLETGLLITRGRDGMTLVQPGVDPLHIPTDASDVSDVTGAGDTVAATFALGVAAGLPATEAALIANVAAGVAVMRLGTHAVTRAELATAVRARRSGSRPSSRVRV